MLITILNVVYVLLAAALIGLILLQRGPGAYAGSGFGAGASATVFGARGSATFLTRSTAVLATLFFLLTLGMATYVSRAGLAARNAQDLGVVAGAERPALEAPAPTAVSAAGSAGQGTEAGEAEAGSAPAASTPAEGKTLPLEERKPEGSGGG